MPRSPFIFGENTKCGVLRRNRIKIKEVVLPVSKEPANPPTPTIEVSHNTGDVFWIAT